MEKEEYVPYGPKWKKEIKKLPKDVIIEMLAKKGVKFNELREALDALLENYTTPTYKYNLTKKTDD